MQKIWLSDVNPVPYLHGDEVMRDVWGKICAGDADNALILAEFDPTYTAGTKTREEDIVNADLPVVKADRGGSVTWHGPGQLVIYPVVQLREPLNVVGYIRAIEAAVLEYLTSLGLPVELVEKRTGVWLRNPDRKICAIGVKVSQGVTLHGIALNLDPDFSTAFCGIVPCGLGDAGVTSLAAEGINKTFKQAGEELSVFMEKHLSAIIVDNAKPSGVTGAQD